LIRRAIADAGYGAGACPGQTQGRFILSKL
jgi:hypothetical protein